MNNWFEVIFTVNVFIVQINSFLSPEHSVETCFTRANWPAVCVDSSLCKGSNGAALSSSTCADERHVCCAVDNEVEPVRHLDAFVVPRWDWTEWFINWTYPSPPKPTPPPSQPSIVYPPLPVSPIPIPPVVVSGPISVPIHNESAPIETPSPASPDGANGPGCGARLNVNQKDMDDLGFIVGGNIAQPHSWPWVAAVYSSGRFICGAAVIDQRYILCAAHCVSHTGRITRAESITVQIGAHDRRSSGAQYKVEKIIVHSGYNERVMQNDISMFKLATPINFGKTVAPVCLPPNSNACTDANKQTAYLAGWGTTSAGGSTSNELREVAVPVIQLKDCQRAYDTTMVTGKQICAGYLGAGGKDSCQGDSGGPMVVRPDPKLNQYYQCGIVSWGRGCAESRYPGVYTKVSEYVDWIRANKI